MWKMKDIPQLLKNVRKGNMYNFAWTDVFHMLTKIKGFIGFPCVYISLNIPWIYRVNGKHGVAKKTGPVR